MNSEKRAIAYCFASGHLCFGNVLPVGALPILTLPAGRMQEMQDKLGARARLGYDNETLFVPGVPEAKNQSAALDAMMAWKAWATKDLMQ